MTNRYFVRMGFLAAAFGFTMSTGVLAQESDPALSEPGAGSDEHLVYALMNGSNSVAVINLATGSVQDRFSVEGNPHGGAITPDGRFIYTASMGSEKISVLDVQSGETIRTIDLGSISHHSIVSPDGRYVYVAADQVVVIDTASNRVITRVAMEEKPFYFQFTPDGSLLYVLGMGSTVSVIDPSLNKVIYSIPMAGRSMMGHMTFRPDGKEIYVTNDADDMVSVIDAEKNRLVTSVRVGSKPHGIAATADGRFVVVGNRGGSTLSIIDTESKEVVMTREIGERPEHITVTPDGDAVLVGIDTGSNKILSLDPASFEVLREIDVWPAPHTLLVSGATP